MIRIGILSDTHGSLLPACFDFFKDCDELWHAGDIGDLQTANRLHVFKPLKAVFGNIDGQDLRMVYPEVQAFSCEEVKVLMMHIGGYPERYQKRALQLIYKEKPGLFISGHSHILKVMYDKKFEMLHINPGAAGNSGLHHKITMVRLVIDGKEIKDLEIKEIDR